MDDEGLGTMAYLLLYESDKGTPATTNKVGTELSNTHFACFHHWASTLPRAGGRNKC